MVMDIGPIGLIKLVNSTFIFVAENVASYRGVEIGPQYQGLPSKGNSFMVFFKKYFQIIFRHELKNRHESTTTFD